MQAQAHYDHYTRYEGWIDEETTTLALELQQRLALGARHDIVWGPGARTAAAPASTVRS